jgi:hypothetical protein
VSAATDEKRPRAVMRTSFLQRLQVFAPESRAATSKPCCTQAGTPIPR